MNEIKNNRNPSLYQALKTDEPIILLVEAILKCAAEDYRSALKSLKSGVCYRDVSKGKAGQPEWIKDDCEIFFRSEWFKSLCDLDGEEVIKRLRKEVGWDRD